MQTIEVRTHAKLKELAMSIQRYVDGKCKFYNWASAWDFQQCGLCDQQSLRIRAVWSEPLLVAWIFYECWATDSTSFGVSKLNRRLQRPVRVYTCQNVKLLEISCTGSYHMGLRGARWLSGRVLDLGLRVQASLETLCCFLEQYSNQSAQLQGLARISKFCM